MDGRPRPVRRRRFSPARSRVLLRSKSTAEAATAPTSLRRLSVDPSRTAKVVVRESRLRAAEIAWSARQVSLDSPWAARGRSRRRLAAESEKQVTRRSCGRKRSPGRAGASLEPRSAQRRRSRSTDARPESVDFEGWARVLQPCPRPPPEASLFVRGRGSRAAYVAATRDMRDKAPDQCFAGAKPDPRSSRRRAFSFY